MMGEHTLAVVAVGDAQSLTLPKLTARSRTRVKRPRKPSGAEVWFLTFTVACAVFTVLDVLDGSWLLAGWQLAGVGIYWRAFQRARRGVRPEIEPLVSLSWVAALAPVIAVTVLA